MAKINWRWTNDNILMIAFMATLIFVAIGLFVNTGKSCDTVVDFIVVGEFDEINGTIPELQFKCIELCSEQFESDGYNYLELCYDQCVAASELGMKQYDDPSELCVPWMLEQQNSINFSDIQVPMDGCRGFVNESE